MEIFFLPQQLFTFSFCISHRHWNTTSDNVQPSLIPLKKKQKNPTCQSFIYLFPTYSKFKQHFCVHRVSAGSDAKFVSWSYVTCPYIFLKSQAEKKLFSFSLYFLNHWRSPQQTQHDERRLLPAFWADDSTLSFLSARTKRVWADFKNSREKPFAASQMSWDYLVLIRALFLPH